MSPSINFKVKSSKSLQINKQYGSKGLLAMTLNKNSALVNLNNRSQFNKNTASHKYHPNVNVKSKSPPDNNNSEHDNIQIQIQPPKTFNPSKQWMDALLKETPANNGISHKYRTRTKAIKNRKSQPQQNTNGTLTVNNHTFTGIWAKTLPKQPSFPDFDDDYVGNGDKKYDDDDDNDQDQNAKSNSKKKKSERMDRKNTVTIHSLFEQKQSQQANNIYAYSVAPKYSVKEMESINNSNND